MNNSARHLAHLLLLIVFLSGCTLPPFVGVAPLFERAVQKLPAEKAVAAQNPQLTPSPTPFQPLPPTPVITPTEIPTLTPEPSATPLPPIETQTPPNTFTPAEPLENLPKRLNILLLGSDRRPGGTIFRTDTIILVSIDTQKGMVHVLSFPRDLYVYIPGWTQDRINVAWQHGGFDGLAATMQQNFGVKPTHYALINFRSFKRIVDDIGGLEVNVGQPLYDRYPGKGWITIPKGKVHMNADMALWYVRSRKTSNDFARNRRQQEVLLALFEKFISLDALTRAPEFYKAYKKAVVTNLKFEDGLALIPIAAQVALDRSRIKHYYISPEMAYDYITPGGAMVLLPDEAAIRKLVKQVVGGK